MKCRVANYAKNKKVQNIRTLRVAFTLFNSHVNTAKFLGIKNFHINTQEPGISFGGHYTQSRKVFSLLENSSHILKNALSHKIN